MNLAVKKVLKFQLKFFRPLVGKVKSSIFFLYAPNLAKEMTSTQEKNQKFQFQVLVTRGPTKNNLFLLICGVLQPRFSLLCSACDPSSDGIIHLSLSCIVLPVVGLKYFFCSILTNFGGLQRTKYDTLGAVFSCQPSSINVTSNGINNFNISLQEVPQNGQNVQYVLRFSLQPIRKVNFSPKLSTF